MGTLQVVATPIGNLDDVTLRSLQVLREAQHLYAEDTRRVRTLLSRHEIAARPISLYAENEEGRVAEILEKLERNESVVVVSDAGTPLISDPGARLVAAVADAGHRVEGIPGPSAVLTALSVCGLRVQPFTFVGFLPRKPGARKRLLETYVNRSETFVIFESPNRLGQTLLDLVEVAGSSRKACVCRELTKLHEEVFRGDLGMLAGRFSGPVRGEITIVVEGSEEAKAGVVKIRLEEADLAGRILELVDEGKRPREIATQLSSQSDVPRREIYARAVAAKKQNSSLGEAGLTKGETSR
ncbi:MAG: 16S rRNA (cytidine(1402)-2'-O)-methyltransferase [Deltaproteobacteria bacterium]|nr:16S rRNA (cytidine(1402)-2'-O)-methyltransferase [Deltaproteobacteria bacterium]